MNKRLLKAFMLSIFLIPLPALSCVSWDKTAFICKTELDCPTGQVCRPKQGLNRWCMTPGDTVINDMGQDVPDAGTVDPIGQ